MRGNAREWYLDQGAINNYDNDAGDANRGFKQRFLDRFAGQEKKDKWYMELHEMKQKENESINEYAARFRKVLRKVNQDSEITLSFFYLLFLECSAFHFGY